jgi:hypothetical protein
MWSVSVLVRGRQALGLRVNEVQKAEQAARAARQCMEIYALNALLAMSDAVQAQQSAAVRMHRACAVFTQVWQHVDLSWDYGQGGPHGEHSMCGTENRQWLQQHVSCRISI